MNIKIKKFDKFKIVQTVYTFLGILFIGALLCIAIIFPTYYCKIYDKNTLNKISHTNARINTYETSYESFPEKIRALAIAVTNSGEYKLRSIHINEPKINMNKKELTKIANNELADMRTNGIIQKKFRLNPKRLSARERYTIYQADGNDDLQGINCLKLVYENPKKTITIYLDEEFHKIYFLDIKHNTRLYNISTTENMSYYKTSKDKSSSKAFTGYYNEKKESVDTAPSIYDEGQLYTVPNKNKVFSGILRYYNFGSGNNYDNTAFDYWIESEQFCILFTFEDNYYLKLYESFYTDEYEKLHYTIGIPLNELIQF